MKKITAGIYASLLVISGSAFATNLKMIHTYPYSCPTPSDIIANMKTHSPHTTVDFVGVKGKAGMPPGLHLGAVWMFERPAEIHDMYAYRSVETPTGEIECGYETNQGDFYLRFYPKNIYFRIDGGQTRRVVIYTYTDHR